MEEIGHWRVTLPHDTEHPGLGRPDVERVVIIFIVQGESVQLDMCSGSKILPKDTPSS